MHFIQTKKTDFGVSDRDLHEVVRLDALYSDVISAESDFSRTIMANQNPNNGIVDPETGYVTPTADPAAHPMDRTRIQWRLDFIEFLISYWKIDDAG